MKKEEKRGKSAVSAWLAVGLAACAVSACRGPRTKGEAWRPERFEIGLMEAPPQTDAGYAQAAKADFTLIVSYVGPDALDLAQRHGLKLAVAKIGLDLTTFGDPAKRRRTGQIVRRFRDHPALWGYYLGDCLRESRVDDHAPMVGFLRERDPRRPFVLGALPCDAWAGPKLRTADYASYLARVLDVLRPPALVIEHFPFRVDGDGPFYFENLELARHAARARGLPLYPMLRCGQRPKLRELDEPDLRWLVYTSLAYGARGVIWLGYWQARDGRGAGIVDPDGTPTDRYRWVAALNAEMRALGPHLLPLRSVAVYHTRPEVPAGATRLPPHGLVGALEGGSFVLGQFAPDAEGRHHLLVTNKNRKDAAKATLTINHPCRAVEWFDTATRAWAPLALDADPLETSVKFPLPPGDGLLVRLDLVRDARPALE